MSYHSVSKQFRSFQKSFVVKLDVTKFLVVFVSSQLPPQREGFRFLGLEIVVEVTVLIS